MARLHYLLNRYVNDNKAITVANTSYTVGGIQFALTLGTPSGTPDPSDDWGRVYYYAGNQKTPDTNKAAPATYGTGTITSVVATLAREQNEEDNHYNARNTAENFRDALNTLAGQTITVTIGTTGTSANLKFSPSQPSQLAWQTEAAANNKTWANAAVSATATIVALASDSQVTSVTYNTFSGLNNNTYYIGVIGLDKEENGDQTQDSIKNQSQAIYATVSVGA